MNSLHNKLLATMTFGALCAGALISQRASSGATLSPQQQEQVVEELQGLLHREYVVAEGAASLIEGLDLAKQNGLFDQTRTFENFVATANETLQSAYPDPHLGLLEPARFEELYQQFHGERGPTEQTSPDSTPAGQHHNPSATSDKKSASGGDRLREVAGITRVAEISRDGLNRIGYLAFDRLDGSERSRTTVDRLFQILTESERVIIDLRECGGGDAEMVIALSSYFFDAPTHLLSSIGGHDSAGRRPVTKRMTEPNALSRVFAHKPLDILVSSKTFSAAESFAFGMRSLGRARIIGQTTGGGGFSNDFFPLSFGLGVSLSVGRSFDPRTGDGWQIIGIAPDVSVQPDHALSETVQRITRESGKLEQLSPEQRAVHHRLQHYTRAWYEADPAAMSESITADFAASHKTSTSRTFRDHDEQIAAAGDGMGVQERLFHNRIIRNIQVEGSQASAELVLRATSHRVELRAVKTKGPMDDWKVVRDDYEDKRLSG